MCNIAPYFSTSLDCCRISCCYRIQRICFNFLESQDGVAATLTLLSSPSRGKYVFLQTGQAAKAALANFYETLRFELNEQVGITIATHGWVGSEIPKGRFMLEEGKETLWKDERDVQVMNGAIEKYATAIVAGACKGDGYVKHPNWHDIFLLYRVFIPNVLGWTLRLLIAKRAAPVGRPIIEGPVRPTPQGTPPRHTPEGTSPRELLSGPFSLHMSRRRLE